LSRHLVRQQARYARTQGVVEGAPDLAIEIVPLHDRYGEVPEKVDDYLDAGTRPVVVVNPPKRTATVYRSRNEPVVLGESDVLEAGTVPGWSAPLRLIFPRTRAVSA
jgi:Uma2 family endonuclease